MAEILARAKMEPLHLEAYFDNLSAAQLDAFERQLEAHISHTRHLRINGRIQSALDRLILPAPILESLFLTYIFSSTRVVIRVNLFNCTAPSLTSLELKYCDKLEVVSTQGSTNPQDTWAFHRSEAWARRLVGCFKRNAPARNASP